MADSFRQARIGAIVVLALLGLSAVLWWVGRTPQRSEAGGGNQPPSDRGPQGADFARWGGGSAAVYVGRRACATCHEGEVKAWTGSHHDLAMDVASEATVLGDFDNARVTHFGVTSTFFRRAGKYLVRTDGPDGALREYEISYTFGVTPLQQYLIKFPDGRVQTLGLAWDARPKKQGGQRWFHLYPDERIPDTDELHWTRPAQNWNSRCAECHSTNVQRNFDLARNAYDTTWSEIDVSCEACHGPASHHVAWGASVRDGSVRRDTSPELVVRLNDPPGQWTLSPGQTVARRSAPTGAPSARSVRAGVEVGSNQQVELCARCHALRVAFAGSEALGRPLLDSQRPRLLDEDLYHADGQMLGEVYNYGPFVQSKMFKAGVRCSDCHDPHSLKLRATGNALCATCHLPARYDRPSHHFHGAGTVGASCAGCHMPTQTYMVVDPRHDHSFRVPRPDVSETIGAPDACTMCHKDRKPRWAAKAIARWYGPGRRQERHYGEAIHVGRLGAPGSAPALATLAQDIAQPSIVRASALQLLATRSDRAAGRAIETSLRDNDALVRSAAVMALEPRPPEGRAPLLLPLLTDPVRTVRIEAARLMADVALHALGDADRAAVEQGFAELVAAERYNEDTAAAHLNLGSYHARRGNLPAAEAEYRVALRLDPLFVPAWLNLADLKRERGDEVASERLLREAIAMAPNAPAAHHALGLALVRQRRRPEALASLQRALELAPRHGPYAHIYAVALYESGKGEQALRVLEQARARHPWDYDVLVALVSYARERGDLSTALRHAEELAAVAPDDPVVRQTVAALRTEVR
jgi:predicted CXXCH cytochrome family protein